MKFRVLSGLFLAALVLTSAGAAEADVVPVTVKVDSVPQVCDPIKSALFLVPGYLTYNPETAKPVMEMPRTEMTTSGYVHPAPWWPDPMQWGGFKQDNPTIFSALLDAGETYDRTYIVYTATLDFYGEGQVRPVYRLTHIRSAKLPEIFEKDDGSALSEGLKTLKASDLFVYGSRAYPVVRKPGEIIVYEIDTDQPGKQTFEQKKFIPVVICDLTDGSGSDAAATSGAAAVPPSTASQIPATATPLAATPASSVPAAVPAVTTAPAAPTPDPCAPYQASNPAYYASCEDRLQKMQRLNSLNAQP